MWPDRVSNPGPVTYEIGALPTAQCGLAKNNWQEDQLFYHYFYFYLFIFFFCILAHCVITFLGGLYYSVTALLFVSGLNSLVIACSMRLSVQD